MSIDTAFAAVGSGWMVFWIQLPVLIPAVAVIIVAVTALWRARPEDVPRVFEAFAASFGRRTGNLTGRPGQRKAEEGLHSKETE